jgi:hypothetical protein
MPDDFANNTLGTARSLELTSSFQTFTASLNPLDPLDYYSFTLGSKSSFNLSLDGLSANADVELLNSKGEVLQVSAQLGTNPESFLATLNAGNYYIKVYSGSETNTDYNLSLSASPNGDAITGFGNPTFDTGVFTVGASGQVSIDYLFDGGIYEGELAIFSLEGMEQLDTDVNEFIAVVSTESLANPSETQQPAPFEFPQSSQPLVGVIDTGFSANNPNIDYSRITLGQDQIDGDANPLLQSGEGIEHGTHVLGIIGATQDNAIIQGINNDAPLWVGRAVSSGKWADSLIEFVDAAKASGQPNAVVNLSFDLTQINSEGVETTRYEFTPAEWDALEYARQNNVLIVAAAGNNGGVMSALGQAWQQFDNIITVGSAQNLDLSLASVQGFNRAEYSNYGSSLDIVADGGTQDNPVLSTSGNDLGTMFGTSVATAKVTGVVSQVWAANPALSYRQVQDILNSTATDLNTPNWDSQTGSGLLNVEAAVFLAKATTPTNHEDDSISTPILWHEEELATERPVNFNYPIKQETFSGWVRPDIGVNLRYSPQFSDRGPLNEPYQKTLYFDAWTWGEAGEDYTIRSRQDAVWFRVAGTNYWVPSAYIKGHPPSNPPLLPPNTTTPISGDRINQLFAKSRLTIDEIRESRQLIANLPASNRASLYRKLQYKVPYFNQRDNGYTSIADVMCNVTTLASCLTFLGVKNPQPSRQFEDVLESIIRNKPSTYPSYSGINARYWWSNFAKLAKNEFGIASSGVKMLSGFPATNLQYFKNFVKTNWEPTLNQGKAIMTGVATTTGGHIVKVVDIDWNRGGIIVDDPYGRAQNRPGSDYKKFGYPGTRNTRSRGSVNTQRGQDEGGIGNDNFWSWSYCAEIFGGNAYLVLG